MILLVEYIRVFLYYYKLIYLNMMILFIFHHIDFMHNDNIIECALEYCLSMYTVNILYMIIIIFIIIIIM